MIVTGKLVSTRRESLNKSQWDVAKELGYHAQYISNIERGIATIPKKRIGDFAKVLKTTKAKIIKAMVADFQSSLAAN